MEAKYSSIKHYNRLMKLIQYLIIALTVISSTSCDPAKRISKRAIDTEKTSMYSTSHWIDTSAVFSKSFTGFALYDPDFKVFIDSVNYDKYFTPASNTKFYTCYASMKTLGEKISGLKYVVSGDSLIFWGTGDPSMLNSDFGTDSTILNFLKDRKEKLYYAPQSVGAKFGAGWCWDDYYYGFSPELSDLPIYGNLTYWKFEKGKGKPNSTPAYFNQFALAADPPNRLSVVRDEDQNMFRYSNADKELENGRNTPFKVNARTTQALLSNAIKKPVALYHYYPSLNKRENVKTVYSIATNRVLEELMEDSDNLVGEQLLLNISYEQFGVFDIKRTIAYITKEYLSDAPDKLVWRDGSGLSRYNLFTPRTMIYILEKMHTEFGEEHLFDMMAVGGVSGTIKKWYAGEGEPYVYAKTGTMSNKHCLSGYIKTKSGKTLIFSFMHNNYIGSSNPLKVEMQKVLERIREEY